MIQAKLKDGSDARIYATDGCEPYVIHGAFLTDDGWESSTWKRHGQYGGHPCGLDLNMESF